MAFILPTFLYAIALDNYTNLHQLFFLMGSGENASEISFLRNQL
jgi:hypothetical protein